MPETDEGFTGALPEVPTEGHSELEGPSPEPSGEAAEGATTAGPTVAETPDFDEGGMVAFGPAGLFPGDQSPETHNGA